MVTPTLQSNAGDQRVCKKKNLSWSFSSERNIRPSGSLFGITRHSLVMPNSDPRTDFSISTSHPWKILILYNSSFSMYFKQHKHYTGPLNGPHQANLVLIAYASSQGSGKPAHARSLARTSAAHSYKQWVKRNLQTESQIPSPSEWLGMRS